MKQQDFTDRMFERATEVSGGLWRYARGEPLSGPACRDLCRELGCSRSTRFRYLAKLRDTPTTTAVIAMKPGRKKLSQFLSKAHEEVIERLLARYFLTRDRPCFEELTRRSLVEFQKRGLPPVSRSALVARLNSHTRGH